MTSALKARLRVEVGSRREPAGVEAELELDRGVLVLFGPSGAGKSLTVKALAGLLQPREGYIELGGEVLFDRERKIDVPAHERRVGYVPQHLALFPFCDVAKNVAFGLPRRERRRDNPRVRELLEELGIGHLADKRPGSLSGGECQRVALARALVVQPRLMLLDEPFASLDEDTRNTIVRLLRRTLERHEVPAVLVTHDRRVAYDLGDRMIRYEQGRTVESLDLQRARVRPKQGSELQVVAGEPATEQDGEPDAVDSAAGNG